MNNKPPDLISPNRPVRSEFSRQDGLSYAVRRVITLVVVFGLILGGVVWLWGQTPSFAPGEIPTIKSAGAFKQKPEEPGGIDIPHQDVQVYREIDGTGDSVNAKPSVEHMLPPPEAPKELSATPPVPETIPTTVESEIMERTENLVDHPAEAPTATTPAPAPAPLAPAVVEAAPVPTPAPAVAPTPAPPPVIEAPKVVAVPPVETPKPAPVAAAPAAKPKKSAPAVAATPKAVAAGHAAIQLAASADEAAAKTRMAELKAKFGSALGSNDLLLVRADLGAKGVFYRIQTRTMPEDEAQSICSAIKTSKGDCLLVRH